MLTEDEVTQLCNIVRGVVREELDRRKSRPSVRTDMTAFDQFWQTYPKKKSKGAAERAWKKLNPAPDLAERILESVERAKNSVDWRKEGGQFIPYPASWLNAKGWLDEVRVKQEVFV